MTTSGQTHKTQGNGKQQTGSETSRDKQQHSGQTHAGGSDRSHKPGSTRDQSKDTARESGKGHDRR